MRLNLGIAMPTRPAAPRVEPLLPICGKSRTVDPRSSFFSSHRLGSFLNVCISRIPEGVSIVSPGSRCPRCSIRSSRTTTFRLRLADICAGKCRNCRPAHLAMYPLVEFATGDLSSSLIRIRPQPFYLKWLIFSCLIIVLVVTIYRVRSFRPHQFPWPGDLGPWCLPFRVPSRGHLGRDFFSTCSASHNSPFIRSFSSM